ncbi:hypothetical protein AB0M71_26365 [Amycolatopsis sp. NPDC051114]
MTGRERRHRSAGRARIAERVSTHPATVAARKTTTSSVLTSPWLLSAM